MNNLQINTQPTSDPNPTSGSGGSTASSSLRLPHYFEKKGYRAIKVIGEGAYGKALLVSTALAKSSFSNGLPNSSKHASPKRKEENSPQDSSSPTQSVPPLVVIKHVNMSKFSKAERAAAKNEVGMLKMLNHPNIVRYYDSVEVDVDQLYICLEYADGGDLAAKIKKNRENPANLSESEMLNLFRQVVDAVGYMHTQKVLHRDLKPQNIFLNKDGTQVKVGDFGFSKALNYTFAMANTLCGTPYYYSPELCKGKPYNSASDVWALGVMLYEMFSPKVPFDAKSIPQLAAAICTKEPARPKELSSERCEPIWLLLCELLCKNPLGRPDCAFILKHPVLTKTITLSELSPVVTTSAEHSLRETRSSTPSMNQKRSPTELPPPNSRAPLALGRRDSLQDPQSNSPMSDRPLSTPNGEDTHKQRPSQQLLRQHLADHTALRPQSRVQHPNLLPPRHPAMPPSQQKDRKVDSDPKNNSPVRRPSLQSLRVGGDNNLVGSSNNGATTDRDRQTHQHTTTATNIFDSLKGLPAIQHPLRLPTPIKHNSVDTKVATA